MSDKDKKDETSKGDETPEAPPKKRKPRKKAEAKKPAAETPPPTDSAEWQEVVGAFAGTISKETAEVSAALAGLTGGTGAKQATMLTDALIITDDDIKGAIGAGVAVGPLRMALRDLRGPVAAEPAVAPPAAGNGANGGAAQAQQMMATSLLPQPLEDEALLDALRTGGVDKVGVEFIEAAVRAFFASKVGWQNIPKILAERMEAKALELSKPADKAFYDVYNEVMAKKYAEVGAALGVSTRFASQKWQNELLKRMEGIEGVLGTFQGQLSAWYKTWTDQMANPAMLLQAVVGGGMGGMPGMGQVPDYAHIYDAADSVVDKMNAVFAGPMVPAAVALAGSSSKIKEFLEDDRIRVALGYADREEMLRGLGVAVGNDAARHEKDMVQFILGVYSLRGCQSGQEHIYLTQLYLLGERVLGGSSLDHHASRPNLDVTGSGKRRKPGGHTTFGDE